MDDVGLRRHGHCHSDCSSACSSCNKKTRTGLPYGHRCPCIDSITPAPTPADGTRRWELMPRLLSLNPLGRKERLTVLVIGVLLLPLLTSIAVHKTGVPSPALGLRKRLQGMRGSAEQETQTTKSGLSFIVTASLAPLRGARTFGTLGQRLWVSRKYVKKGGQRVTAAAIFRPWRILRRRERVVPSAGKKGFLARWKLSKKVVNSFVAIGRACFIFPWRVMSGIPRALIRGTRTAGKIGFVMPWRLSKKGGKKLSSAVTKGFVLPWKVSKKGGKKLGSATAKGFLIPWKVSKQGGIKLGTAVSKVFLMPWKLSLRGGKTLGTAAARIFLVARRLMLKLLSQKPKRKEPVFDPKRCLVAIQELFQKVVSVLPPPVEVLIRILALITTLNTLLALGILVRLIFDYTWVTAAIGWIN